MTDTEIRALADREFFGSIGAIAARVMYNGYPMSQRNFLSVQKYISKLWKQSANVGWHERVGRGAEDLSSPYRGMAGRGRRRRVTGDGE